MVLDPQSTVTLTPSQPTIAREIYQQAIMDALLEAIPVNLIPDTLQVVPIFDRQSDRYQLLCQGWTVGEKRVFHPIIHIEIIQGQVWIQHNQSDLESRYTKISNRVRTASFLYPTIESNLR